MGKKQFPRQRLLPGTWALERKEQAGLHRLSSPYLPPVAQLHLPGLGCRWQAASVVLQALQELILHPRWGVRSHRHYQAEGSRQHRSDLALQRKGTSRRDHGHGRRCF